MKKLFAAILLALCTPAFAAELTGVVNNMTTNKPAAGNQVILMSLASGMEEVARTTTNAKGEFKVEIKDPSVAHLVRVSHHNVNYHRPAPPGTQSVEVEVFDAGEQIAGVTMAVHLIRMEADATNLNVTELFILNNASNPPRTLMAPKPFEFELPAGAQVQQAMAGGPNSMPVTTAAVPTGDKNRYTFMFPIRPGETRFQLAYQLPYNGKATLSPRILTDTDDFAISAPKEMKIEPASGSKLQGHSQDPSMNVLVARNIKKGESVGFSVSGIGVMPEVNVEGGQQGQGQAQPGQRQGPGGGLGAPTNTPDPLYAYRWWIIAAVALIMVIGAGFVMSRPALPPPGAAPASDMLSTLKNELFELETQRIEGKISQDEYEKAKTGLEVLMKRHAAKKG